MKVVRFVYRDDNDDDDDDDDHAASIKYYFHMNVRSRFLKLW